MEELNQSPPWRLSGIHVAQAHKDIGNMIKRRIVLPDGRYLIYYSFENQVLAHAETRADAPKAKSKKAGTQHDAPQRRKTGR